MPDFFPAFSTQYYRRREIALVQRYFGPLKGKRILKLDLWNEAVNTRILQWMQSQGAQVFGIDVSNVTVSRAQQNCRRDDRDFHLAQADIRCIPFQRNSFDFVYTVGTIEHIDEYQEAVGELQRVLKPGGKAIIGVPHKWNLFLRPALVAGLEYFDKYPYRPEKSFSYGEIRQVLLESSLAIRQRTGILIFPGIVRMAELFLLRRRIPLYKIVPLLLKPFEYLEARWERSGIFGYLIVLVAEKHLSSSRND
ncbi:MAG: methyltransferase domain-containing protein [Acidobacteria bacterium]|nr:methyltransferase domain-containing protein [Acidobacteriota bacterium]